MTVRLAVSSVVLLLAVLGTAAAQPGAAPPPARKIPGINADDAFPNACVSCHVQLPELDARLSTAMAGWTEKVDPRLLAAAQAAMPKGVTLKGKHPPVKSALADIPAGCMKCHGRGAKNAPYFGRMLHSIHFGGGEESHFLTMFQGECTHCHKLDRSTGEWSVPSGREK